MAEISRSRTIAAPPHAIWDLLADFGSLGSWADDVDHASILRHGQDGPLGTTRRVQLGRNTFVEQIIEFDPPLIMAYRISGLPKLVRSAVNRWTLNSENGATVVTLTNTIGIDAGPLARAAEWTACRGLAKQSERLLAGLARRLENKIG